MSSVQNKVRNAFGAGNMTDDQVHDRAGGRTPVPPVQGGLTHAQGPHVAYEKNFLVFNVFKIFVQIFVHNDIYR